MTTTRKNTPSNAMDAAEQEAARAKELRPLNASAKGFRSQFVSSRNVLVQALPLYADGATASRRRTINDAISKIGLQADKVHDAYQRLIKFDEDENHHANFKQWQNRTNTLHKHIRAHADEVPGEVDGPQPQQQPGQLQGDIVCGNAGSKQRQRRPKENRLPPQA
jgi:hypothetical protein